MHHCIMLDSMQSYIHILYWSISLMLLFISCSYFMFLISCSVYVHACVHTYMCMFVCVRVCVHPKHKPSWTIIHRHTQFTLILLHHHHLSLQRNQTRTTHLHPIVTRLPGICAENSCSQNSSCDLPDVT